MFSKVIHLDLLKSGFFVFFALLMVSFSFFVWADSENSSSRSIFEDSDQDGLSNDEEKLYGTNSQNSDTDGDGYTDGTEIRSGYDPLKKSPGDRVVAPINDDEDVHETFLNESESVGGSARVNITEAVSKEVAMTLKDSANKQEPLSLDQLKETVQKTMSDKMTTDTLPEIDEKTIKIKKQKYSSLSESEREKKIQDDTVEYVSAVSYILVNNSPVPMKSDNDISALASFVMTNSMTMLSGGNQAMLNDFSQKSQLITEQLRDVEVPENMIPLQVKALRMAQYASTFKDNVQNTGSDDPLAQINTFAKAQGFMGLFSDFVSDVQATMATNVKTKDISN